MHLKHKLPVKPFLASMMPICAIAIFATSLAGCEGTLYDIDRNTRVGVHQADKVANAAADTLKKGANSVSSSVSQVLTPAADNPPKLSPLK